jgi:hypothetical protein
MADPDDAWGPVMGLQSTTDSVRGFTLATEDDGELFHFDVQPSVFSDFYKTRREQPSPDEIDYSTLLSIPRLPDSLGDHGLQKNASTITELALSRISDRSSTEGLQSWVHTRGGRSNQTTSSDTMNDHSVTDEHEEAPSEGWLDQLIPSSPRVPVLLAPVLDASPRTPLVPATVRRPTRRIRLCHG